MIVLHVIKQIILFPATVINQINLKLHKADVGKGVVINGWLRLSGSGRLILGDHVRINSSHRFNPIGGNTFSSIYIKRNAVIEIGKDTGISNAALYAAKNINIGQNVKIGGSVSIYDTDFHSIDYRERKLSVDPGVKTAMVRIEDDVFIGAHSIILKGVTIGKRSVIAAGSVVVKNVPDDELWGGVPAKFIKKIPCTDENND
ncbi:MAG: acyltransferase [Oscillospiraceae bacterium]